MDTLTSSKCDRKYILRRQWIDNNRDKVNALKRKYRLQKKAQKLSRICHENHVIDFIKHKDYENKLKEIAHDNHVKQWKSDKARMYKWNYKHNIDTLLYAKLKRGIYRALGNKATGSKWLEILGYTINDLKSHLERNFIVGMSWENRHQWHIDHVVPLCAFNINDVNSESFKACFGLNNLRPIWPKDNRDKYWNVDIVFRNRKTKQGTGPSTR